jgi:hypothetical protein
MPINNAQYRNENKQIEELQGIVNKSEEDFIRAQQELKTAQQEFTTVYSQAELEIKQLNKAEKELKKTPRIFIQGRKRIKKGKGRI